MGDYAISKIILKIKKEYQKPLEDFIELEQHLEDLKLPWQEYDAYYTKFWNSIGIDSFYYERYPFSAGSYHAYTTTLGNSDSHAGSDFYVDSNFTTRFKDGLWFVEFSSKVGHHRHFIDEVVPIIADAWLGLYGDEYRTDPDRLSLNNEQIVSDDPEIQNIIDLFRDEYNYVYEDDHQEGRGMYGY